SKQVKAFLLCSECEQRLNNNGERWMLRNGYRGHGRFRLRDAMLRLGPLFRTANSLVFSSLRIPEMDLPKLTYFASSVFWRAAVHHWNGSSEIHFGTPYEDEFRQYLLGGSGFPSNASLVVHISSCEKPADVFTLPSGSKQD